MKNNLSKEKQIEALEKSYCDIEILFDNYRNFLLFLFAIKKYFKKEVSLSDRRNIENELDGFFTWLTNIENNFKNDKNNIINNNIYTISMNRDKNFIINWNRIENIMGGL